MRTAVTLLLGMVLGIAVTIGWAAVTGGWYEYEIRPSSRCALQSGATEYLGPAEPVAGFPCVVRTPRFHLP
jgi:hypothetical protein